MNAETARRRFSRRTLLRGAGVTMALPLLESTEATAATPTYPKRLAVLFMGNGINGNHWWAKGAGAAMKLSKTLEPLEPVKRKVNVINGLFNREGVGKGIHPGQTGNILSGVPLQHGAQVRAGVSVDQVLANQLGQDSAHDRAGGPRPASPPT